MSDFPIPIFLRPENLAFGGMAGNITAMTGARLGFDIEVTPSPILLWKSFDAFADNIRSLKEPLQRAVRDVLAPSIRLNFEAEGRPVRWQALADGTVATKEYMGRSQPSRILYATGTLARVASQLNIWTIDGGYQTGEASAYIADLPERAWYGKVHQAGMTLMSRARQLPMAYDIPQRPWALIQDEDVERIELIFYEWVEERAVLSGAAGI